MQSATIFPKLPSTCGVAAWQAAYPAIDFAARVDWWRERWRERAGADGDDRRSPSRTARMTGFVTIDGDGYLDQLVVDPAHWGSDAARLLVDEAKRLSPAGVTLLVNKDNSRAIRFYERNGFAHAGDEVNPTSGRPVLKMIWQP